MNIWCFCSLSSKSTLVQRKWSLKEKSQRRQDLMFWKPQRAKLWVGLSCSSKPVMAWWVHLNWQWAETYTPLVPAMPTVICRRLFYSDVTRQLIVLSVCKVAGPSLLHLPSLRYISMDPALSPRLLLYPSIWAWAYIQVLTFLAFCCLFRG